MIKKYRNLRTYKWEGIDFNGFKISGSYKYDCKKSALLDLKSKMAAITYLKANKQNLFSFSPKYSKRHDHLIFFQELLWLLNTGLTIVDSLKCIISSGKSSSHIIALKIHQYISSGLSFSEALAKLPKFFTTRHVQFILIGEKSNNILHVISKLVCIEKNSLDFKKQIYKALSYPSIVLVIASIISIFLFIYVIPQYQNIYLSFNATLPFLTKSLILLSNKLSNHLTLFFCTILMLLITFFYTIKKLNLLQKLLINTPIIKKHFKLITLQQWFYICGCLLEADIQLLQALSLSNSIVDNPHINKDINKICLLISNGVSFSTAIQNINFIPEHSRRLLIIGDNTNNIAAIMLKISEYYQQQINDAHEILSKFIEPVIMIIVAAIIATVIIAMYLPILHMGTIL